MVERNLLLALVRRIRRRQRWITAVGGGALVVAIAAPLLALLVLIGRRGIAAAAFDVPARGVWVVLLAAAGVGAAAWALRRISLLSCARLIDSAREGRSSPTGNRPQDNCVLAAVALAEGDPSPGTPFLDALTMQAVARARTVPPRRAVPSPGPRKLAFAVVGMGLLAAAALVPVARSRAADMLGPGAATAAVAALSVPRLMLSWSALESEREDLRLANAAARDNADPALARLAAELAKLMGDLASDGLDGAAAVARLQKLTDDAHETAKVSSTARTAAEAARAALGAARGVGDQATSLAAAIAEPVRSPSTAGEAAARLASRGPAGRAALGTAAQSAAAAIAGEGASADGGFDSGAGSGDRNARGQRRLDRRADSSSLQNEAPEAVDGGATQDQRRLEQLRRDLEETGADCRSNPDSCRKNAASAARTLAELHREGQTAGARRRLAEVARQLLDRVRRSGADGGDREAMRRFARAAHGSPRGTPQEGGGSVPALVQSGGGKGETAPGGVVVAEGPAEANGASDLPRPSDSGNRAGDESGSGASAGMASGTGAGAPMAAGGGIGSEPGGPVLGARRPMRGGASDGHEARASLNDGGAGPSRAAVIGSAAASGFASIGYRRVFDDYHAAVEEYLDATAVPPGRRYLVRRYFQLIRPRAP